MDTKEDEETVVDFVSDEAIQEYQDCLQHIIELTHKEV